MNDIEKFANFLRTAGITQRDNLIERFTHILVTGSISPDEWAIISNGAYKEVYELDDTHVIKFVGASNRTETELWSLNDAIENGFGDIFVHETAIDMEEERVRLESIYEHLGYIIIQEKVVCPYGDDEPYTDVTELDKDEYLNNPIVYKNGAIVDYDLLIKADITCKEWLQAVIEYFGDEYFNNFLYFIINSGITNLHQENVGFTLSGKPVIFDWLS